MTYLLYLLLNLLSPSTSSQVEAFRLTAPDYLTSETARDHLEVARAVGIWYQVAPSVLLSIAYHESRYEPGTITPEPGQRVSCGVMTPVPKTRCSPWELSVLGGYTAGAEHLALWRAYYPGHELLAYAGGGWMVAMCAAIPSDARCQIQGAFLARARRIDRALSILGAIR